MKWNSLYTNTGNAKSVVGLLLVTVLSAYASSHATEIVDGTVKFCRDSVERVDEVLHKGKKKVAVCERLYDGRIVDTGKRIWK